MNKGSCISHNNKVYYFYLGLTPKCKKRNLRRPSLYQCNQSTYTICLLHQHLTFFTCIGVLLVCVYVYIYIYYIYMSVHRIHTVDAEARKGYQNPWRYR
jgi:Ca2+/Na+ antiporter